MAGASPALRRTLKRGLAAAYGGDDGPATGITVLIYHRVGGGSRDERDVAVSDFATQVQELRHQRVVSIDEAADQLAAGDTTPGVVLTFDDGFADVHANAWPLLGEAGLRFTVYVATSYVGREMVWEGSTGSGTGAGMSWDQLAELHASGLATLGNHTHNHARPRKLSAEELDRCTAELQDRLGVTPRHFAYTWGVDVPSAHGLLAERFRTAATGELGRNLPHTAPMSWRRVPVRGTDPLPFFRAKLRGSLRAEHAYERIVSTAKAIGVPA